MSNRSRFGFDALITVLMMLGIVSFAGAQATVTGVAVYNLQNPGQPVNFTQPQSSMQWNLSAQFAGGSWNLSANITNSSIYYTQANGKTLKAAYNLLVNGSTNSGSIFYAINTSVPTPIIMLSSQTVMGSVSGIAFQSAVAAPQCPTQASKQLYTEWDYYITVQGTYFSGQTNVVVGRLCIYKQQVGTVFPFVSAAVQVPSSNFNLSANGRYENLTLNYATSSQARSKDGAVTVMWDGTQVVPVNGAPDSTQYVALNSSSGSWVVQNVSIYNRWYTQYNSFTLQNIPSQLLSYSPTSIGRISQSCNSVSGSTSITNTSITGALACLNATAGIYYSLNNQLASELLGSSQNISGYATVPSSLNGRAGFTIGLPTQFVAQPRFDFILNGSFLGFVAPAGVPRIISANTTPIGINGVGFVNVQVANVGTSSSTFTVAINNCPGISTEPGISYQIAQGQIGVISAGITSTNANLTLNEECLVSVTSSNGQSTSQSVLVRTRTPNQYIHSTLDWLEAAFCSNILTKEQAICVGVSV